MRAGCTRQASRTQGHACLCPSATAFTKHAPCLPAILPSAGIKITQEPPKGVRANLLRTYNEMPAELLDPPPSAPRAPTWRKLVFSVAFFHAIIQVRTGARAHLHALGCVPAATLHAARQVHMHMPIALSLKLPRCAACAQQEQQVL